MARYQLIVDTNGENSDGLYYALKDYGFRLIKQTKIGD